MDRRSRETLRQSDEVADEPQVAEYSVQRNYLDLFLDLPWNEFSEDQFDLKRAQKS